MISTLTRRVSLAAASLLAVSAVAAGVAPAASARTHHPPGGEHAGVLVSKTVVPSWTRTYSWTISKTASPSKTFVRRGGTATIAYAATLSAKSTDAYSVSGSINIANPSRYRPALVKSVTDVVSPNIAATVTCPVALPTRLDAGKTLTCTYKATLPDATARTNTATVTTVDRYKERTTTATKAVTFPTAPTDTVDECVAVSDVLTLKYGQADRKFLGNVCAADLVNGSKTISYSRTFGPLWRPGAFAVTNTAAFVTNDTHTTGSASATTLIIVLGRHHHYDHHNDHYDNNH